MVPASRLGKQIAEVANALANDPRRSRDLEDVRALLRANRDCLNMIEVRDYFRLFDQETLLNDILDEIA